MNQGAMANTSVLEGAMANTSVLEFNLSANPVLVYHFDEAPPMLRELAWNPSGKKYIILVPTGIYANAESFERRLNITRAEDLLKRFEVENKHYAGTTNLQISFTTNIDYRVFIV